MMSHETINSVFSRWSWLLQDGFVVRIYTMSSDPALQQELQLKLARKCLHACGISLFDLEKDLHIISKWYDMYKYITVTVHSTPVKVIRYFTLYACVDKVANVSEVFTTQRNKTKKQTFQLCLIVYWALNSMLFSQAQALMKKQHCLEQAGSLLWWKLPRERWEWKKKILWWCAQNV